MTQDEMKQAVATAALDYVTPNTIIGVGTGSTANFFIDALASIKNSIQGTVASSNTTAKRLKANGIKVFDLNEVEVISVYIDGADEANEQLQLIKGGGGALTKEKIVAAVADKFICIIDESKLVSNLGTFALPVEVIPMATNYIKRKIAALMQATPMLRKDFTTDNGNFILDIEGLKITDAARLETQLNSIAGVVANGLFANRPADILLLSTQNGVQVKK